MREEEIGERRERKARGETEKERGGERKKKERREMPSIGRLGGGREIGRKKTGDIGSGNVHW